MNDDYSRAFTSAIDSLEVERFYNLTYAPYIIRSCRYGTHSCRDKWTLIGTIMGKCLRLNVNEFANVTSREKLLIQFIVNKSDTTVTSRDGHGFNFLTNSAMNGITLYPTYQEEDVIMQQHAITLEQKIVPSVRFQKLRRLYAGEPYTKCRKNGAQTLVGHTYKDDTYREEKCLNLRLYMTLCEKCKCYPSYVDSMKSYHKMLPLMALTCSQSLKIYI